MQLIELSDYTLLQIGTGNGLNGFYFSISESDICSIDADSPDDAHLLLKAIATLVRPLKGTYRFMGKNLDFSNDKQLLSYKKQVGYIASDAALIRNLSIRENLLLMRYYFENSLLLDIDKKTTELCINFNIYDKLDLRPGDLRPIELRIAIAIRELSKSPAILLIEHPENFIMRSQFDLFMEIIKDTLSTGLPLVFISHDKDFVKEFSNRNILISGGRLTTVAT
ncbi:MAG: hypothetical protein JRD93_12210 [Deltaproteobacteria bacterium]|nr:hypothetical protein [Deltaproteobacteria bacterium]